VKATVKGKIVQGWISSMSLESEIVRDHSGKPIQAGAKLQANWSAADVLARPSDYDLTGIKVLGKLPKGVTVTAEEVIRGTAAFSSEPERGYVKVRLETGGRQIVGWVRSGRLISTSRASWWWLYELAKIVFFFILGFYALVFVLEVPGLGRVFGFIFKERHPTASAAYGAMRDSCSLTNILRRIGK
jgi:hypothetical protein